MQIQLDPRYASFVERAAVHEVLGALLVVAGVEDVLQGKPGAVQDTTRLPGKRQKDPAGIARLLEAYPALRARVPTRRRGIRITLPDFSTPRTNVYRPV